MSTEVSEAGMFHILVNRYGRLHRLELYYLTMVSFGTTKLNLRTVLRSTSASLLFHSIQIIFW